MKDSFWKRNGGTILACVAAAGTIVTTVLAVKATPKVTTILKKAEEDKGEELTKLEVIKTAAPAYIPAVISGAATIACIFGIDLLSRKQQASIMSAYALLESSYNEYRKKVAEIYGVDADEAIKIEADKDAYAEAEPYTDEENQLFLDFNTLEYFEAPFREVVQKVTMDDGLECYIISTPWSGI